MRHGSFYALALSVFLAPVLLGTVHMWTSVLCALILSAGVICELLQARHAKKTMRLNGWSLALGGIGLWALIQCIPLPVSWLSILAPEVHRLHLEALAVLGSGSVPSARPISLDVHQSVERGIRWLCLAQASFLCANVLPQEENIKLDVMLRRTILFSGCVCIGLGLVHQAIGHESFLGLVPTSIPVRGFSPFVNLNHAASFYGLCALLCTAGLLFELRRTTSSKLWTGLYSVGTLVFMLSSFAHESRSVTVFLVLSLIGMSVGFMDRAYWGRRLLERLNRMPKAIWLGLFVFTIGSALVVFYGLNAAQTFWGWADSDGLSRWLVAKGAAQRSADFWAFGSGAGTVEHVIYSQVDFSKIATAKIAVAENEAFEWMLTLGWPVTLIALCVMAASSRVCFPWLRKRDASIYLSRLILLMMFVYALVIFSFHFPFVTLGLGLPIVIAMEALFSRVQNSQRKEERTRGRKVSYAWGACYAGALVVLSAVCVIVYVPATPSVRTMPQLETIEPSKYIDHIHAHPANGRFFELMARRALRDKDHALGVRAAQRAFALQPMAPMGVLLAQAHKRAGDIDAAVEQWTPVFNGSFHSSNGLWLSWMLEDLRSATHRAKVLAHAEPSTWGRAHALLLKAQGALAGQDLLLELISLRPEAPALYQLLTEQYLSYKLYDLSVTWSQLMRSRFEGDAQAQAYVLLYRALIGQQQPDSAQRVLTEGLTRHANSEALWLIVLQQRPAPSSELALVRAKAAHTRLCLTTLERARAIACAQSEVWRLESTEPLKAQQVLERLAFRYEEVTPLVNFYVQHGQCLKLKSFASMWQGTMIKNSKASARQRRNKTIIKAGVKRCTKR